MTVLNWNLIKKFPTITEEKGKREILFLNHISVEDICISVKSFNKITNFNKLYLDCW